MNKTDINMVNDIYHILENGYIDDNPRPKYKDGSPAHTISVNQVVRKYDLSEGQFPICTLRPIAWKSAIKEILWIYQKASNSLDVLENEFGIMWWREWESEDIPNTIGQRYGATVDRYKMVDNLIKSIKEDPFGRRKIMSLWQENDLSETDGLAPCAFLTMWNVRKNRNGKNYLDMTLIQRSGDMLTASGAGGVNEVQYAALLMMIARHCDLLPGVFVHFVQNEQIYDRHIEQAEEMKHRYETMLEDEYFHDKTYKTPYLKLNDEAKDFYTMTIDDFEMVDYEPVKPQLKLELGI